MELVIMKYRRRNNVLIIRFIVDPDEQTRYETVLLSTAAREPDVGNCKIIQLKCFRIVIVFPYKSTRRHRYGSICKLSERVIII